METPLIRQWEKHLLKEIEERTVKNYISTIKEFREFIRKPLDNPTYDDFDNYLWRIKENGMRDTTINMKIKRIKLFYRWYEKNNSISEEIVKILNQTYLRVDKKEKIMLTLKRLDFLLKSRSVEPSMKYVMVVIFFTLCGNENIMKFRKSNFIENERYAKVKIPGYKSQRHKVGYIPKPYYKYVKDYLKQIDTEIVFPARYNDDEAMVRSTLWKTLDSIGYVVLGDSLSVKDIRRGGINFYYRNGMDVFALCELAGYKTFKSLQNQIVIEDMDVRVRYESFLEVNEHLFHKEE